MARSIEFIRKSEARIIIFLVNAELKAKNGSNISYKLDIDYIYTMKILGQMYNKGWIGKHKYDRTTYYKTISSTPINEAKSKLAEEQVKLR